MNFKVKLWPGAGYWLEEAVVDADNEEQALVEASKTIGQFIDENDADDDVRESEDIYMYLDRSEAGLPNGYLCIENAVIERQ